MVAQHDRLCGQGPSPYVDIEGPEQWKQDLYGAFTDNQQRCNGGSDRLPQGETTTRVRAPGKPRWASSAFTRYTTGIRFSNREHRLQVLTLAMRLYSAYFC